MTARQLAITAQYASPPSDEVRQEPSLVARLASRLRLISAEARNRGESEDQTDDADLLVFARGQIESRPRIGGVDLAHPLSISVDAVAGAVRAEIAHSAAETAAAELLTEVIASIAPALFADGRVARVEVGLVRTAGANAAAEPPGVATQWAIARPGHE